MMKDKWLKIIKSIYLPKLLNQNRHFIGLGLLIAVLGVILVFSKKEDNKVILYKTLGKPNFTGGKILSNGTNIYQKKDRLISQKIEKLEDKLKELNERLEKAQWKEHDQKNNQNNEMDNEKNLQKMNKEKGDTIPVSDLKQTSPNQAGPIRFEEPERKLVTQKVSNVSYAMNKPKTEIRKRVKYQIAKGPNIISFPVQSKKSMQELSVTVPSGSFVKAKLLTGVEAAEGKALPVLLQADYAFVGPNKSKIDLSGCFLIAKSMGNLSIERVEMQATKISCVGKTGKMFERKINGFIADNKDNSFAVIGEVNSKQDRVASMAFLASIVQGVGGAISQAQTTTQSDGSGGSTHIISGDQTKYLAAGGASNAASMVTQWYLKHAQGLLPTINIGSGADVWIVMQDSVALPNWYFKKQETDHGGLSFLTRLTE